MADAGDKDPAPYQSLYRRFRPQRFEEVLGQEHVSLALRNAVRDGRVGHAYLFSGPRGTGKTSTARILAKALNCAALEDGEPCGRCDSCVEIARGASLDVHELDAASNNGVDAMRDLVSHAALGTPGRWKVYIVDEVHMLSTAASNALLKTLEEPPATSSSSWRPPTPRRCSPPSGAAPSTSSSDCSGPRRCRRCSTRCATAAGLALPDEALDAAVRRGRGSARDALSALDQVAAGGIVDDDIEVLAELAEALAERDPARALVAVAHAVEAGRDPQRLAADLAEYLRQGFLAIVAGELVSLSGADRTRVEDTARRMGLPALVRALEELGRAQVDMRDIPDQRVHLEVALIKLTHPAGRRLHHRAARTRRAPRTGPGRRWRRRRRGTPVRDHPGRARSRRRRCARSDPPPTRARGAGATTEPKTPPPAAGTPRPPVAPGPTPSRRPAAGLRSRRGSWSGPELARRTLGAVRRQSGVGPTHAPRAAPARSAGRSAPSAGAPSRGPRAGPTSPPTAVRSPPRRRATSWSRSGATGCWPAAQPGPGPVPGGEVPRRRRGAPRSSRCPTRRTVPTARRSGSTWKPPWRRASGRRCRSGSWSTTSADDPGRPVGRSAPATDAGIDADAARADAVHGDAESSQTTAAVRAAGVRCRADDGTRRTTTPPTCSTPPCWPPRPSPPAPGSLPRND